MQNHAPLVVALALFAPLAPAQLIVNDGDDLSAIVDAAPSGSLIEIQSDATFVGSLFWHDKALTIRAGAGFAPTIEADPGGVAVRLGWTFPQGVTTGVLEGLRLTNDGAANVVQVGGSGTGDVQYTELRDCVLEGDFSASAGFDSTNTIFVTDTEFGGQVKVIGANTAVIDAEFADSEFVEAVRIEQHTATPLSYVDFSRCRFEKGVQLNVVHQGAIDASFVSCLFIGSGASIVGINLLGDELATTYTAINCTITGHLIGVEAHAGCQVFNGLIYDNVFDVLNSPASAFFRCLIGDGTHDGVNGNFTGVPEVAPNYALYPCSPGIDAASFITPQPGMGTLDLYGDPRIQDGDGDQVAAPNVGAVETPGSVLASAFDHNPSGNPVGVNFLTAPLVGTTMTVAVGIFTDTLLTAIAFDAPSPSWSVPGVVGQVYLALSGTMIVDVAAQPGLHFQPIPNDCALIGVGLRVQGFRLDTSSVMQALDAIDFTIGA